MAARILLYPGGTENIQVNTRLTDFSQVILSSLKILRVRRGETASVPIVLRNSGHSLWSAAGRTPVNVSYVWFDHGKQLAVEGYRTFLPRALRPGDSTDLNVNVKALATTGDFCFEDNDGTGERRVVYGGRRASTRNSH